MKRLIVCVFCVFFCGAVMANLSGSDDFNDNTMDPAKWSIGLGDSLSETNNRLEYSGGSGEADGAWVWEQRGSYVQDWAVSLDVVVSVDETTIPEKHIRFGLITLNPDTAANTFAVGLNAGGYPSDPGIRREIVTNADVNHAWVFNHGVDTIENSLQLQISFDSSAKVLTSYYDSGGGLTALTNYSASAWGMTASDVFTIAVFGSSNDWISGSGEVYGDNFVAVPEPGTLGLLGVAAGGLLLTRQRHRLSNLGDPWCRRKMTRKPSASTRWRWCPSCCYNHHHKDKVR